MKPIARSDMVHPRSPVWSAGLLLALLALLTLPLLGTAGTLGEAVTAALAIAAQNPRIDALHAEGEAVARQAAGLIAADPALRVKHVTDRITEDLGADSWEAMVEVPLWLPGQQRARRAIAGALSAQAEALQRRLRWDIAGQVREAAWAAALAQGQQRQAEQALASSRSLTDALSRRAAAGELARLEVLVARQELLDRETQSQAAALNAAAALHEYRELTGEPALPEPLAEPLSDLDALPDDHPLLDSADGAVARARAERERAVRDARGNPLLSLGGTRVREAHGLEANDAVQLELSIPFGLASQAAPLVASAERDYTERTTELHLARLEAERALAAARLAHQGAIAARDLAERRDAVAQEALALMRRAFDLGETDLAALLRAQTSAHDARLDLALRRLEVGRAVARLNHALGVVPE